jgi:hypothetical protein
VCWIAAMPLHWGGQPQVVLGPAADGGYYLIGLSGEARSPELHAPLFQVQLWGAGVGPAVASCVGCVSLLCFGRRGRAVLPLDKRCCDCSFGG